MYIAGGVISGLIAIGCLIGCLASLYSQSQKRKALASTTGVVVSLEKRVFKAGSAGVYCPAVDFTTNTGESIRFESSYGTMPASQKIGDHVKVNYNPNSPKEAEIESGIAKWLAPGCLFLFSVSACLFSLVFLGLSLVMSGQP